MKSSLSEAKLFLDRKGAESVSYLTAEPARAVKIMGQVTDRFGGNLVKKIPPEVFEKAGNMASGIVIPRSVLKLEAIKIEEFDKVIQTVNQADRVHYRNVALMFAEGSAAGGVGSIAGLAIPGGGLTVAFAELPINYLLLLRMLLDAQRAFYVTPDLRNANRAFEMASATTIEAKLAAWSKDSDSMLSGVIARRISTKHASKLAGFTAHTVVPLLPNLTVRSVAGELSDAGSEQVASSMIQAGLKNFCQKHPQLMACMFPIVGALLGGLTSAMSAKRSLLVNYHLSRLEYIENIRRMLKLQTLLTGSQSYDDFATRA